MNLNICSGPASLTRSRPMHRTSIRKNRFHPGVECLDQRELLAANLASTAMPVTAPAAHATLGKETITVNYDALSTATQPTAVSTAAKPTAAQQQQQVSTIVQSFSKHLHLNTDGTLSLKVTVPGTAPLTAQQLRSAQAALPGINAQVQAGQIWFDANLQTHQGPQGIHSLARSTGGGDGGGGGGGSGGSSGGAASNGVKVTNTTYGEQVSFTQAATQEIISVMQDGAAAAGIIAAILGPSFPTAAVVPGVVAGILGLGQGALQMADAAGRGIYIDFFADAVPFWVGSN